MNFLLHKNNIVALCLKIQLPYRLTVHQTDGIVSMFHIVLIKCENKYFKVIDLLFNCRSRTTFRGVLRENGNPGHSHKILPLPNLVLVNRLRFKI